MNIENHLENLYTIFKQFTHEVLILQGGERESRKDIRTSEETTSMSEKVLAPLLLGATSRNPPANQFPGIYQNSMRQIVSEEICGPRGRRGVRGVGHFCRRTSSWLDMAFVTSSLRTVPAGTKTCALATIAWRAKRGASSYRA
jgi:hypothetical protein